MNFARFNRSIGTAGLCNNPHMHYKIQYYQIEGYTGEVGLSDQVHVLKYPVFDVVLEH